MPLTFGAFGRAHEGPIGARGVDGSQTIALGGRQKETGVLQAERFGDTGADEFVEWHAGRLLHHAAKDVGVVAVDESLARLSDEREHSEPLHGLANGLILVGGVPSVAAAGTQFLRLVRVPP